MAGLQGELQSVQFKPARWQAVLGPAIAGVGLLILSAWHCRCSSSQS